MKQYCVYILTNKNNPVVECRFRDIFPTSLSGLEYSQNHRYTRTIVT